MTDGDGRHPRAKPDGTARGRQITPSRVRDLVLASLRDGHISLEQPLAEDDLMRWFDASRGSVRTALAELRDAGLVERRPKFGTRVNRLGVVLDLTDVHPRPGTGRSPDEPPVTLLARSTDHRVVPSFPLVAERLGLPDDVVCMVENTWTVGTEIIGFRTAYFSTVYRDRSPEFPGPFTMRALIENFFQTDVGDVEILVGAETADPRTARTLGVDVGAPVVLREMTYRTPTGNAIQTVFDRYRADRVRLHASAPVDLPDTS